MMIRKRRESKQSVVVVLEGLTVSTEKRVVALAPLKKAMVDVKNADDEILILTLLYMKKSGDDHCNNQSCSEDHHCNNQSCSEGDVHFNFLREEICKRKKIFVQIFRPYYDSCRRNGVKFQVKIAADFQPKDIIIEEANNSKATWIVMDRCFVRDLNFQLSGTECDVSLVSEDEDEDKSISMVKNHLLSGDDGSECSMLMEVKQNYPKSAKLMEASVMQQKPCVCPFSPVLPLSCLSISETTSRESEKQQENENLLNLKPSKEETSLHDDTPRNCSIAKFMINVPLQLSWEVIMEMTGNFSTKVCIGLNYTACLGYLTDHESFVLVKRFTEDAISRTIFEVEKKAVLSMHHKNILGLLGYHHSEITTVLVYPHPKEGTLDNILCGIWESELILKFQEKLKIAIGIAQGVRYMHEECLQGPLVHGDLQLSNIFLRHDLRPLISGFGKAKWLHLERVTSVSDERGQLEDTLDHGAIELVKSDVFSFGVLLIRLFSRRSIPLDDRSLIEWARPLMQQRKFHELLEEDLEISDMHGIYRVMAAATQCTKTKPMLRPCMSEGQLIIIRSRSSTTMATQGKDVRISLLLSLALISCVANGADHLAPRRLLTNLCTFDVTHQGVKAGAGQCKQNAVALTKVWVQACQSVAPAKVLIPPGTFEMSAVVLEGPCKNPIIFEIQGTLKADTDKNVYKDRTWFSFEGIDGLQVTGRGTFDGQGPTFWSSSKCNHKNSCNLELPSSIKFCRVTNTVISGFTSLNPPAFHMHVIGSSNFTAHSLTITAPGDSPNTDGMHISTSCNVKVLNCKIGTGDDCISVGQGNTDVTISGIQCGPGHGVSIGSLGKYQDEKNVNKVLVTDSKFTGTTNGARIKTWLNSPNLKATAITFQNLVMDMVKNPIVIDQEYGSKSPVPSNVQLSDIHFRNITGTSTSEATVNVMCSKKFPCCVDMANINLVYKGADKQSEKFQCANAKLTFTGKQNPAPCPCRQ
ncbi:hypothetical protein LWI28_011785 [Acer negundo]|uniref:Protein kinase domain-containing protein n=1 Tax=Acer negundo TaxID=4023 RepID=A0AAD5NSW2_ACENE|nr:hypothetical protein LWI28_011785 [Acer negundo]